MRRREHLSFRKRSHAMTKQILQEKISSRTLRAGVIGLGYVGLPLATTLATAGFHVTGIDVDARKIEMIERGKSYIPDIPDSTLLELQEVERLHVTADWAALAQCDVVSICVPTPLRKTRDPDISYIISATKHIREYLHVGQLII